MSEELKVNGDDDWKCWSRLVLSDVKNLKADVDSMIAEVRILRQEIGVLTTKITSIEIIMENIKPVIISHTQDV